MDAQFAEIRDLCVDLGEFGFDSGGQVAAGDDTGGIHAEEVDDLGEAQAKPLGLLDRADSLHGIAGIVAVARPIAWRCGQNSSPLVVPERLWMHAIGGGKLAATHVRIVQLRA